MSNSRNYNITMRILYFFILSSFNVSFASEAMVSLGEKIFRDVRFSKHFFYNSNGNVNTPLDQISGHEKLVSCATCHRIDEDFEQLGMRSYSDFETRTRLKIPISNMTHSLRNTTSLMGIGSRFSRNDISHYDGELLHHETYLGNFTGPHHGWEQKEKEIAKSNIVKVLREDNDRFTQLDYEFSYATLFLGVDPAIPDELRLKPENRVNIDLLSDDELIQLMATTGAKYLKSLDFQTDQEGDYSGSMYDQFLKLNNIPRGPKQDQTIFQYSRELLLTFKKMKTPKFVPSKYFEAHKKSFEFQEQQWRGLKVFFNINANVNGGRGMCVQCHTPPLFTDQSFHNVAVTQKEFELKNGEGSFAKETWPDLEERNKKNLYFLNEVDLGVWNFFARSNKSVLTSFIRDEFCPRNSADCNNEKILPLMIARFKTPGLRNLAFSDPYFHNGSSKTIKDVLTHYQLMSIEVKKGNILNPAPQMRALNINKQDIEDLEAFLSSLNENYE